MPAIGKPLLDKRWVARLGGALIFLLYCLSWAPLNGDISLWLGWLGRLMLVPVILLLFIPFSRLPRLRVYCGRAAGRISRLRARPRAWLLALSAAMFCIAYILSQVIYGHLPGQMDGYAYYIQAKIFASGHWYVPSHPLRQFFDTTWFINDGKFYSKYPPGHPLLLSFMMRLGMTWLYTPLLSAAGVMLAYCLGKEVGNRRVAMLAAVLTLVSPVVIFMSAEYMNHTPAWVCTTGFALFYIRAHRRGRLADALIAGGFLGLLFMVRPQVGAVAIPFGLYWLLPWTRPKRSFWICGIGMGAAFLYGVAFSMYYDLQTTGNMWLMPFRKYEGFIGFKIASIQEDIMRMSWQLRVYNTRLLCLPVSSFLFVWLLFQARLRKPYAGLLFSGCAAVALSLMFIPYTGGIYAPRYLFEINSLMIVLTALCIDRLALWLKVHRLRHWPTPALRLACYAYLCLLLLSGFPQMVIFYREVTAMYWRDHIYPQWYYSMKDDIRKPALVFVRGGNDYFTASLFNPPRDDAPVIAARDYGEKNYKLAAMYPDRFIYTSDNRELKLVRSPVKRP